jgi:hypothetical protein
MTGSRVERARMSRFSMSTREGELKLWQVPLRLASGAFVLDQGLSKRSVAEERAEGLHDMATTAVPQFESMEPRRFVSLLSDSEIALGSALLVPLVPSWLAGAGLTAFASNLMRLYLKAPGLRREGSLRPSERGLAIAKDSWLLAIGLALLIGDLTDR